MTSLVDLIGIPYKENGRSISEGFDCYGLCIEVCARYGKKLNDLFYSQNDLYIKSEWNPTLNVIKADGPAEGRLVEMACGGRLHTGVCIDTERFIHATAWEGVRVSKIGALPVLNYYEVV